MKKIYRIQIENFYCVLGWQVMMLAPLLILTRWNWTLLCVCLLYRKWVVYLLCIDVRFTHLIVIIKERMRPVIIVLMVRWAMCGTSSIWSWAHFMLISCMYLYLLKRRRLYINADELFCYDMKEAESPFGFEEDQHRMHTKRQARLDPGVLLLLTTCEIWDECNVFFTVGKAKPMLIWRSLYAKVDYVLVIVLV